MTVEYVIKFGNLDYLMAYLLSRMEMKIVLVLMVALVVVSCGRRGKLERPAEASVVSVDENGNEVPADKPNKAPDKPFILDPLL